MKAFNNDPKFRDAFVNEMRWHKEQDKFKHGTYGEGSNGDFRGCAVGCGIHSLLRLQGKRTKGVNYGDHGRLAKELSIPVELFHLQDALFEALPADRAMAWPLEFSEAIPCGADLSMVHIHFMYWLLADKDAGVIRFAGKFDAIRDAIQQVTALLMRRLSGLPVSIDDWSAAESAARSAAWSAAESAAWSAARSAAESAARSAAWSAAESAAWSAAESAVESAAWSAAWSAARSAAWSAAESAAWSAARSAAWSAAWSAARLQQADKLLQLIREAPVSELEVV